MPHRIHEQECADVVGIGFGPANMALAIALNELAMNELGRGRIRAQFYDAKQRFGWHNGMLFDGATMQISFLKDLATLRNPTSDFSFVAYLHAKGRLQDFINKKSLIPSRIEFNDYLNWAADRLSCDVNYSCCVVKIEPVLYRGIYTHADISVATEGEGNPVVVARTKNVVIGIGTSPHLPSGVVSGPRVWHNSELGYRVTHLESERPTRLVVVGSGQSAAETVEFLHRTTPNAIIYSVTHGFGFTVADDSQFVNQVFDSATVDLFYSADAGTRSSILNRHSNTNYSAVDGELIEELYRLRYEESVTDRKRLHFLGISSIDNVRELGDSLEVDIRCMANRQTETVRADALIYATGYRHADPTHLLGEDFKQLLEVGDDGELMVDRDYRVRSRTDVTCGIYVHGAATERTHGLSSGLLSNVAVRAGELADSIAKSVRNTDGENVRSISI